MINSFGRPIIPVNDEERVTALHSYHILHTEPEMFFNNLASIMAQCFEVPIALVTFVDKEQVFFKANVGMNGTTYFPRGISLCSLVILEDEPTIFENTLDEPCLLANPLVAGELGLRFYAGAPLVTDEGYNIGTVCVVDKQPRSFSDSEKDLLKRFAQAVMESMAERRKISEQ